MQELAGQVGVVTGGGSGIGRAIATALAAEGMRLAVLDIDIVAAEETAAIIQASGQEAVALRCDVSSRSEVKSTADAVFERFGAVHVLCNNAGVTCFKAVTDMTDDDWDWMINVDLMSIIYGYQAYLPRMVAQRQGGHVVNTSSGIGVVPDMLPRHTAYAAAKGAGVALSSSLRVELADQGIGVSVLCPGMVRTQILNSGRTRQQQYGGPRAETEQVPGRPDPLDGALDPAEIGQSVVEGIKTDRHFIFPQAEIKAEVVGYYERMLSDF